ncbi:MAG: helix-turn-helix domain-containing protein [Burkholderiaceae bacterium]|nr:helix-turn-helix domain-containing protein [Burkholderiaceae bacterium]
MRRTIAVVVHPGFQLLDAAGPTAAFEIAERLRPGSYDLALLAPDAGQVESSAGLSLAAEPLRAHLAERLTVERLAERAAMSPRNFARAFVAQTGTTLARAVERLRLEIARAAVETSHAPLERIAEATGFGDLGRMRRAFLRNLGQPPQALRRRRPPAGVCRSTMR